MARGGARRPGGVPDVPLSARPGARAPRVLHVVESWPPVPSGYASRSRWIVETQARTGIARPAVLVTSRQRVYGADDVVAPLDGVPVELVEVTATERALRGLGVPGLGRPFHVDGPALARRIEAAARAHGSELVHVHWASAVGAAAARAARRLGLPLVAELRFDLAGAMLAQSAGGRAGGRTGFAEALARRWFDRHLGSAAAIVVASDALGAFVGARLPARAPDVVSVPNGIDAAFLAACDAARAAPGPPGPSGPSDAPRDAARTVVGTTSKMLRYEGLEALLGAARELPAIDVVFVGDGPERGRLEELARPLNAERAGRVHFAGRVPAAEIPARLAAIDVFAVPRRDLSITRHASPIKVLEAMAAARCTVAAAVGDTRTLLADGCGLLTAPGDGRAFVDALRRAADDPALRARLGAAARVRAGARYRGDELVARYRDVYARAITGRADVARSAHRASAS